MPTRPDRPALGARYDSRRAELVEGAAKAFAEHGYERTSMADLARMLGIATGSAYHYFDGKEALGVAICNQLTVPLIERVTAGEPAAEPAAALGDLVGVWLEHVTAHLPHMLVFQQVRHLVEADAAWRSVRDARSQFEAVLRERLASALPPGVDSSLRHYALLGMVNHTATWFRPGGRLSPAEIARGYVELTLA